MTIDSRLESIAITGIRPRWGAGLSLFAVGLAKKGAAGRPPWKPGGSVVAHFDTLGLATGWIALLVIRFRST